MAHGMWLGEKLVADCDLFRFLHLSQLELSALQCSLGCASQVQVSAGKGGVEVTITMTWVKLDVGGFTHKAHQKRVFTLINFQTHAWG